MPTPQSLPSALDPRIGALPFLHKQQQSQRLAVFLDYDGTLTPIVSRPELAVMSEAMRETVRMLAEHCPVAIVSGRDRADVQHLVGLKMLYYAGSHGFDIIGPQGASIQHQVGHDFLPILDRVEAELHRRLQAIEGVLIDRKVFSIAIHVRHVEARRASEVESEIDAVLSHEPELRKGHGKKVFELQPSIDWHKGQAVRWLLNRIELEHPHTIPLYLGDDVTDEDAFEALSQADQGFGILVAETPRPTAAQFILHNPEEVRHFLQQLTQQVVDQASSS